MAPPSRSSSSLPLVVGGALIIVLAGLAFFLLQDDEVDPVETSPQVQAETERGRTMDVPEGRDLPEGREETATALRPTPSVDVERLQEETDTPEAWEDPVLIVGWVEDTAQERLAEVEVSLHDDVGEYLDSQITNERGEFVFTGDEGLPAGWTLMTEPMFLDEDDPDAVVPAVYTHAAPVVPGDDPAQARLVLAAPPRLEGRVYDAATSLPIELADIEVVCLSPAWEGEFQDAFSDEAGLFSMRLVDVPAQDIIVRVADDEDRYAIFGPLSLAPGEVRYLDVPLSDPIGMSGVVLASADASPIPGADVTVMPAHIEFEATDAWDVTDEDGSFLIDDVGVPADRIWLYVQADDYGPELLPVSDPGRATEVRLGEVVTITGTVLDAEDEAPVDDAIVRFVLTGPSGLYEDVEDMDFVNDDGSFSIPLELVPVQGAEVIVESDSYLRFRAPLSELAPTHLGLRSHDVTIVMRPLPAS